MFLVLLKLPLTPILTDPDCCVTEIEGVKAEKVRAEV